MSIPTNCILRRISRQSTQLPVTYDSLGLMKYINVGFLVEIVGPKRERGARV